jgi:mRNA-degrading endonuclease RelE of RelBE toxin-antitoxin system
VWQVEFTAGALRQFKKLPKAARGLFKAEIRVYLAEMDPATPARNKFRLRRASPKADYELRVGGWRVFYRWEGEGVVVTLLGEKRGNVLVVEGEEIQL